MPHPDQAVDPGQVIGPGFLEVHDGDVKAVVGNCL